MSTPQRIHVLACGVLAADLRALAPRLEARLTLDILPGKLHRQPAELRRRVQERIDAVSAAGTADLIAIAYGLCGRGTAGLMARNIPLRVPRVHDCIALFLGSDAAYQEQFARYPGTYYVSAGWVEEGMGCGSPDEIASAAPERDAWTAAHGAENAAAIATFLDSWKRNYQRAAFIDTGIGNQHHARLAQRLAQENAWRYEALAGSHVLLEALLRPQPDERILDMAPGWVTAYDAVARRLTALPAARPAEPVPAGAIPGVPPAARRAGLGLGIDAGGTYTDAVIFDWDANRVRAKAKAPTTHGDYAVGIGAALDQLPAALLAQVRQAAVSTTLATNAIVEGRGQRVGLLLMPPEGDGDTAHLRHRPTRVIAGRMAIDGQELQPVDVAEIVRVARELAAGPEPVRAFAVTGYASHVNPAHELAAMAAIRQATGLPVTCGHEVSAILNYRVRAETAALNARIIPCLQAFLSRLRVSLDAHGVAVPASIVRSDGSLMNVATAVERPVETLLSGPAASVAGARYLCDLPDALVVDMGGTTTDTAVLHDGVVRSDPDGATVGHWRTHVRALAVRTLGLGGDSEVRRDRHGWHVGPRRVVPVCRLGEAGDAPAVEACLAWLERHPPADPHFWPIYATLPDADLEGLDERQRQLLALLREGPQPVGRLLAATGSRRPSFLGLEALVDRLVVRVFGFTPTDALHLLGGMTLWNTALARRYAALLAVADASDPDALARQVVARAERQLGRELLMTRLADLSGARTLDGEPGGVARALLDRGLGEVQDALEVRFSLGVPVIGIGAPAAFFLPAAAQRLQAEAVVPPDGDVANAIGAITSDVRVTREATITPDELGRFRVGGIAGAPLFVELEAAQAFAEHALRAQVLELASKAGATAPQVVTWTRDRITEAADGLQLFVGRSVWARASGLP